MITLALIEFDPKKQPIQPVLLDAFEVSCVLCRNTKAYTPHELIAWEGPLPGPTFRPHSAFQ
jgi:hypothetical protein